MAALTQAAKSSDAAFQLNAVAAIASLVSDHKCNQSAAAAAGRVCACVCARSAERTCRPN